MRHLSSKMTAKEFQKRRNSSCQRQLECMEKRNKKRRTLKDLLDSFHNLQRAGQLAGARPSGSDRIDGRLGGAFRQPVERVVNQAQAFQISDVLGSALWTRKFDQTDQDKQRTHPVRVQLPP